MPEQWVSKRVLIVVRTYPTPAQKGIEVSCTAGITDDGQWIRLFPVPYRFLEADQRFRKYQTISANFRHARGDQRPESYNIDVDSLKIRSEPLTTRNNWAKRKAVLAGLTAPSLCALETEREQKGAPTLGFFRPREIGHLEIRETSPNWSEAQLARLQQNPLFGPTPSRQLEKLPYEFRYHFRCDDESCPGHNLMCTDWEAGQAFRTYRKQYGGDWEAKFRQRFETELIERNDTHFYVGTVHRFPSTWLIVGLFYPRK